ncbi:MAG: M15 family metallopeptidase [Oscillospiraceae bacterium]
MPYRYKKKHYKIKPVPVLIALLTLVLLVWVIGTIIMTSLNPKENDDIIPPSSAVVSDSISTIPSSDTVSSKLPSSDVASSMLPSSDVASSMLPSSDVASSKPHSSTVTSDIQSSTPASDIETGARPVGSKSDWNLILLNSADENKIDADLDIQKTKFDTQWVDSRAAKAYEDMRKAAAKKSITLYLRSGYRSISTQQRNYDNEVARFVGLGNSKEESIRLTNEYYAIPGRSEHHTGLAFDIITPEYHNTIHTLNEKFAKTAAYKWLVANCADYGFILRYEKDKKDITGINFEPWHYRYVGVDHAKYMTKNGLCLEEYMKLFED